MFGEQQQQAFNDSYTALILQEAEKLYNELITELKNRVIAAVANIIESSLPVTNKQKLTYKVDNTYQAEESRYNQNRNL